MNVLYNGRGWRGAIVLLMLTRCGTFIGHRPYMAITTAKPVADYIVAFSQQHGNASCFQTEIAKTCLLCAGFERLKPLSELKYSEFISSGSPSLKIHRIDRTPTSVPAGFALKEQLRGLQSWQFEITRNEHRSAHGFLTPEALFLVSIDPYHRLHP